MTGLVAFGAALAVMAGGVALGLRRQQARLRAHRLAQFRFPPALARKVRATYPHLSDNQVWRVLEGLREFFAISAMARGRLVAMPSQVVDVAWHEFILSTRAYQAFCRDALGRFLHHTPAEAMRSPTQAQEGIRRAWRLACLREGLDPRRAARLPLLFALDAELAIADGFHYALDCAAARAAAASGDGSDAGAVTYCGSDIGCGGSSGCASGCGGDSGGHGSSDSGGDSGGGDSGGGDGGCGGGGCGGGD